MSDLPLLDVTGLTAILATLYGRHTLKPCPDNLRELIVTILSHRTNKANETRAFEQMWAKFGSWAAIQDAPLDDLTEMLSPAKFPDRKAIYIQQTLAAIIKERGEYNVDFLAERPLDEALAWLQALPGVGIKTASLVMLFCFHKPALPVDTHVHRVSTRVGILPEGMSAEKAHEYLLTLMPPDAAILYDFHKLLLKHGQQLCTFFDPKCEKCPVRPGCLYYLTVRKPQKER